LTISRIYQFSWRKVLHISIEVDRYNYLPPYQTSTIPNQNVILYLSLNIGKLPDLNKIKLMNQ